MQVQDRPTGLIMTVQLVHYKVAQPSLVWIRPDDYIGFTCDQLNLIFLQYHLREIYGKT